MTDNEQTKPAEGEEPEQELDTEGHNIFATHDYYVQRNTDRRAEVERDARDRARARQAEDAKRTRR
jgi:hypothetical protein